MNCNVKLEDINDDCWRKIFSYLNLKSMYMLEISSEKFQEIMRRIDFWQYRLRTEHSNVDIGEVPYETSRRLYWVIYVGSHECNVCNLCFISDVCPNIPDCRACDWLSLLD